MQSGRSRSKGWAGLLTPLLAIAGGCVTNRAQIEQAVVAQRPSSTHSQQIASSYRVRCPDILQVDFANLPQYSGKKPIEADGRVDLGDAGRPRVDGETVPEIVRTLASVVGISPQSVRVTVAEYNSQFLYLYGSAAGLERAVPYRGPETIVELLQRVGGLGAAATPRDIKVVRPHVADGKTPEVFTVDLAAILLHNDPSTNIQLEPFDQIHIGQSRRSCVGDCMPPWFRPIYDRVSGLGRRKS
jgi:protein involved in polysaccharide export with SLBB domain